MGVLLGVTGANKEAALAALEELTAPASLLITGGADNGALDSFVCTVTLAGGEVAAELSGDDCAKTEGIKNKDTTTQLTRMKELMF